MGKKISELDEMDEIPSVDDYLPIVDASGSTTKRIKVSWLLGTSHTTSSVESIDDEDLMVM